MNLRIRLQVLAVLRFWIVPCGHAGPAVGGRGEMTQPDILAGSLLAILSFSPIDPGRAFPESH